MRESAAEKAAEAIRSNLEGRARLARPRIRLVLSSRGPHALCSGQEYGPRALTGNSSFI